MAQPISVPDWILVQPSLRSKIVPPQSLYSLPTLEASSLASLRTFTASLTFAMTSPELISSSEGNVRFNSCTFNVIYLLTQGVYTTTNQAMANSQAKEVDLLITWLFNLTQSYYNYKMASTIGIIVFILCAVFTLIAFSRFLKGDREEAFR